MLKAILFDLDDTLIDWSGFDGQWEIREAAHLRRVFDFLGGIELLQDFEGFTAEFMYQTRLAWENARGDLRAPNLGRVLAVTAAAFGVPVERLDERQLLEVYEWGAVDGTRAFPDAIEALTTFANAGIKLGIITNAYQPMWMRDREMKDHGLLEFFPNCRFSAADVSYLKPHPLIFETALECAGAKPDEAVFVGDNPVADIAGAQGAGIQAVLRVAHPVPPMLSGLIVPDAAINTLLELPDILDGWFPGWR